MSEKQIYPSDTADKVLVRMPDGMREQLKVAAKSNNRTMNAEIVARLQSSFQTDESEQREFEAWREVARRERIEASAPTMTMPLDTEGALKEYAGRIEALMAAREDRMREWWMKEFGYDPQAPQIKREPSKGPTRSPNARKKAP